MEYKIDEIVSGEVTGIQSYGAFVKLPNGEQGLIHISEISTFFVKSVSNFVQLGQIIKVKIIDILEEKNLYRLSLKHFRFVLTFPCKADCYKSPCLPKTPPKNNMLGVFLRVLFWISPQYRRYSP